MKSIRNILAPIAFMLASASVFALQIPTGDNVKVSDIKQDGDAIVSATLAENSEITLPTGDKKMYSSGSVLEFYKSGVLKEFTVELQRPKNILGVDVIPVLRYGYGKIYDPDKPALSEEEQKILDGGQNQIDELDKKIAEISNEYSKTSSQINDINNTIAEMGSSSWKDYYKAYRERNGEILDKKTLRKLGQNETFFKLKKERDEIEEKRSNLYKQHSEFTNERNELNKRISEIQQKIEEEKKLAEELYVKVDVSMSESGSLKNFSSIIHSDNYVNSQDSFILIKMGENQIAVDNVDFYDTKKDETPKISKIHLYRIDKTYTFQVNGINYEVSDEHSDPLLNDKAVIYFWPNGSLQLCYAKSVSASIETSLGKITARTEDYQYDQEKLLDHQGDYGYYERGELGDSNFNVSFYEDGAIQSLFTDEFLMTNLDGMKLNIPAGSFLVFWPDGKIRFCKSSAANTLKIKNATFDIPENEYYAFDKNGKFIGTDFGLKRYCSDVPDENTWGWANKEHPKSGRTYKLNFSAKRDGKVYKFKLLPSDILELRAPDIIPEIERSKQFVPASLDFDRMEVSTYEKDADGNIVLDDLWFPKESAKKYKLLRKQARYYGAVGYVYYVNE